MSYRLINSNALATSCAEVNNMPCIYADLPNGLDGGYYDLARGNADKSRWFQLFGTPERAARTLAGIVCDDGGCEGCTLRGANCSYDENVMLEWLRGDA